MAGDDCSCKWSCGTWCYIISFVVSTVTYVVAVALSWSFALTVPGKRFAGVIAETVPIALIVLGVAVACGIGWFKIIPDAKCRGGLAAVLWLIAFLIAGVCSVVGGIILFVDAAHPPPEKDYNRNNYIAFAAFAGIFAVIAGIAYCSGMCGLLPKVSEELEKESSAK